MSTMPFAAGFARPTFSCLPTDSRSSASSYQCSKRCDHPTSLRASPAAATATEGSTEHVSQQSPSSSASAAIATSHEQQPTWARHRRRQHWEQQTKGLQDESNNNMLSAAHTPPQQQHGSRATLLYIPRGLETQATAASTHGLLPQDCSPAAESAMTVQTGVSPAQQQQQIAQHPHPQQQPPQQRQQRPSSRDMSTQHMRKSMASDGVIERRRLQLSHKHVIDDMGLVHKQQHQVGEVAGHPPQDKNHQPQQRRRRQRVQHETSLASPTAHQQKGRHVAAARATAASPAAAGTAAVAAVWQHTEVPVPAAVRSAPQIAAAVSAAAAPELAAATPRAGSIAPVTPAEGCRASGEEAMSGIIPITSITAAADPQVPAAAVAALVTPNAAPEAVVAAANAASPSTPAAAAVPPSKWQLAVNKRLQTVVNTPSMASVRQARLNRLQHRPKRTQASINNDSSSSNRDRSSIGVIQSSLSLKPGALRNNATSHITAAAAAAGGKGVLLQRYRDSVESGGGLSAAEEADLCDMYQKHLYLQDQLRSAHEVPSAAAAAMLVDASQIQEGGLTAQQLLLQSYEPLIINRSRRAAALNPSVDFRELRDAAARAVLTAAAKFDREKARGNGRLASLAAVYIKTAVRDVLREYQSAPVVLPSEMFELRRKLSKLQQQLTVESAGLQPTTTQLAAAARLPLNKVTQVLQATSMQASGLVDGVDDADGASAAAGGDVDLLQLDVTQSADDLDYIAGAVKSARQGLKEEQQAAEEAKSLAAVMQQSILSLEPKDRTLLALRLGLVDPSTIAAAAAAATSVDAASDRPAKRREKISDRIPVIPTDTLLHNLESVESLEDYNTRTGLSVAELSRLFNMPRQRGHQLFQGVVQQLKESLRNAARSDAELALLLAAARGEV